jgi:hypothetical protein
VQRGAEITRSLVLSVLVIALAGGFLLFSAGASLLRTPTDDLDGALEQYEQLLCVEDLLRDQIPAGSTVAVSSRDAMLAADPTLSDVSASYWYQRLTELAYPRYDPASSATKAQYAVGLAVPFGGGECNGVGLQITEQV